MEKNVGGIDRVARIIVGVVVLGLFFVLDEGHRLWALAGAVPLLTGLIGWCPAYVPFGIRSCKARSK